MMDNNLLTFHEKVDNIIEEQDELRNKHLEYLKQHNCSLKKVS